MLMSWVAKTESLTSSMPINRGMDKENAVHINNGILCMYSVVSDSLQTHGL